MFPILGEVLGYSLPEAAKAQLLWASVLPFNNKFYFDSGFGTNLAVLDLKVHIVFMSFINII